MASGTNSPLPPISGNNELSDFSPTTPNPAANGRPGALIFAGDGAGRTGTRGLVPGYYAAVSPRLGVAYSPDSKTVIRAAAARSYGRVSALASSSHYAGFIGQYAFTSPNQGITPAFNWDAGMPPYQLPPQINPSFANNQNVDYWYNNAARPNTYDNWTLSVQRQITSRFTLEADYNATIGERLNAGLMNLNQVPMPIVNTTNRAIWRFAGNQLAQFQYPLAHGCRRRLRAPPTRVLRLRPTTQ